jgi:hypothetical protein
MASPPGTHLMEPKMGEGNPDRAQDVVAATLRSSSFRGGGGGVEVMVTSNSVLTIDFQMNGLDLMLQ